MMGLGSANVNRPGLVRAEGTTLRRGDRPFRFLGANRYDLCSSPTFTCGRCYDDAELERVCAEIAACGFRALRTWAFAGHGHGGRDFSAIDRVVAACKRHDLLVVFALDNEWPHCTPFDTSTADGRKGGEWFAGGWRNAYLPWLEATIDRYRDEPQILLWQLLNEPECPDPDALHAFCRETSARIKAIDRNHLVSLGTLGTGQAGTHGDHYRRLHELPTVDIVEAHDYNEDRHALPRLIADDLAVAQALGKPFVMGEVGIRTLHHSPDERAQLFAAKIQAALEAGVSGYMLWSFYDLSPPAEGGWDFSPDDPLVAVVRGFARAL